jgi:hypothetical protein
VEKITMDKASAAITVIHTLSEAIRAAGKIPQGHLYAQCMGAMDLGTFEGAIRLLVRAKLVESKNYELTWIGPSLAEDSGKPETRQ